MRLVIIFGFLFPLWLLGQNRTEVDSITYFQYMNKDYKALKITGEKALADGIDFFYLRMRMGVLAFENERYFEAIAPLKEALNMNPSDDLAQECLYYAYLYSGQTELARLQALSLSKEKRASLHINSTRLEFVSLNAGYLSNAVIEDNKNTNYLTNPGMASESVLNGSLWLSDITAKINVGNRSALICNFSTFQNAVMLHGQVDKTHFRLEDSFTNYQANLVFTHLMKSDFKFSLGAAFFNNDIAQFVHKTNTFPPTYAMTSVKTNSYQFSGEIEMKKYKLQPRLAFSYSNLAAQNNIQGEFGLNYYPMGNQNLYFKTSLAVVKMDSFNLKPIFSQLIGFKIQKHIWAETSLNLGVMQNYVQNCGLLTYNTSNPVHYNIGVDLYFKFGKLTLVPSYRLQQRSFLTVIKGNQAPPTTQKTFFLNHVFNFSIKWNF